MRALPHTRSCFVCGETNPIGLKLTLHTDGQIVQTEFVLRPEHVGFKNTIHGGVLSTVLDEVMSWVCAVATKRFAYCAELTVRFARPGRPAEPMIAKAELSANRRGKVFEAKGEIRTRDGAVVATATGKYMPVRQSELVQMAPDLLGDAGDMFGR